LVDRGDEVVILDDLSTGHRRNIEHLLDRGDASFVDGSTGDADLVDELMGEVDGCFHLASAVGVQLICDRPLESLLKNVRGCDIVIAAAARHGARLLYTSTSEIYGKDSVGSLTEESDRLLGSPQKGRWSYATAKVFGEMLAYGYAREHGAEAIVVRLFNTVGPRQTGAYGMVVPSFVRQALRHDDLTVHGDGSQSRCFAHVFDSVAAIVGLFDSDDALGEVFNVGATMEITISELASLIIERTESLSSISYVPFEDAYEEGFEELGRRKPDTSALESLIGWRPKLTIDDAIDDVMRYEQAHAADTLATRGEHEERLRIEDPVRV